MYIDFGRSPTLVKAQHRWAPDVFSLSVGAFNNGGQNQAAAALPVPPAPPATNLTTTIPDPSSSISQSLSSCSGPSGTRTSTLSLTNNESYTAYYLIEYSTNSGSSYSTAQTNQSISGGATNTANSVVVSDGSSIIWRFKDSRTSNDFSNASYEILSVVTVDCPDGYYVNVDGSTYALGLECRNWNNNTKARFRANPWWMNDNGDTAVDYMNALIALTGDYDDGDTDVEMTDYFDYSSSFPGNCSGLSQGLSFVFKCSLLSQTLLKILNFFAFCMIFSSV